MSVFQVWFAGDRPFGGVHVVAEDHIQAAAIGAAKLFEASDPLDAMDVFVAAHARKTRRFRVLAEITRQRYEGGSVQIEAVEFIPTIYRGPVTVSAPSFSKAP